MHSKLAFITGASKGIGRAIALETANSGLDVIITARNVDELKSLENEVSNSGQKCYNLPAELNNVESINNLTNQIQNLNQKISLLVHAAGVAKVGSVKEMSLEDWDLNLKTNLTKTQPRINPIPAPGRNLVP